MVKKKAQGRPPKYTSDMKTISVILPVDAEDEVRRAVDKIKKRHLRVKK